MQTRTRITAGLLAAGLALTAAACDDGTIDLGDQAGQVLPDADADVDVDADVDADADGDVDGDVGDGTPATSGTIAVGDQVSDGIFVSVAEVTLEGGPGFVTIRADVDGAPGPVLGHAAVPEGRNLDVQVKLDQPIEGEIDLWAVIHIDADFDRVLDFPSGNDVPLEAGGDRLQEPFTAFLS